MYSKKCNGDCCQWRCTLQHGRLGNDAALDSPEVRQASDNPTYQTECEDKIPFDSDRHHPQAWRNRTCHDNGNP
jgi:hypothetical protein